MQAVHTLAPSAAGSELPVLNVVAFERTASFLDPENVRSYMQTLITRSETLLREIRAQAQLVVRTGDLTESVHALGGSASLFSFQRLAFAARGYEQAVETNSPEVADFIENLTVAIEASLPDMRSRMSSQPA
jgi:HPt (histidine-containing phosphotransfer) domain-containing protein